MAAQPVDLDYWFGVLVKSARRDEPRADTFAEAEMAAALTMGDITATAREVFGAGRYIRVVLLPVEGASGTE